MITQELNFPTLYELDRISSYGGNQEWFLDSWKRKAGCGCTSGANLAIYYASNDPNMASVYDGNIKKFEQMEYLHAMEEMYSYMKPGPMGYPYVKKFAKKFLLFCKDHGISMEAKLLYKFHSSEEAFRFVKDSIDGGHPVALLILLHRAKELREDNWHWVTITGYIMDQNTREYSEVILSNCGERQLVYVDTLFEVHLKNKVRMVCFQPIK